MEGNQQKMREALIIVYDWILKAGNVYGYPDTEQKRRQLYDMMTKALASPPRNCDVGTAEEQHTRYNKFCYVRRSLEAGCGDCPLNGDPCCELAWAQMPYEEEQKGEKDE